jgi:alkylation response protein AidB-like acyl-CoA dehydrogenase
VTADFEPSLDTLALRDAARGFLSRYSSTSRVREAMDSALGYDAGTWAAIADQVGLQSMLIPVEYGGAGGTYHDLSVVLHETGRALLCGPHLPTVFGSIALLELGTAHGKAGPLCDVCSGSAILSVAFGDESGRAGFSRTAAAASQDGDGWTVTGFYPHVLGACWATLLLVPAVVAGELRLFGLRPDADGLTMTPLGSLDPTWRFASLRMDASPAQLLGTGADTEWELLFDRFATVLAAEQVGGAQRCMEMAVEYVKTRTQFGRVVGSFQAVKHRCAQMYIAIEAARVAADYAQACAQSDPDGLRVAAPMARAVCSETYSRVASDSLQLHGGIGFTWEHDAHLFLKRAKAAELLLGDVADHRRRLADALQL